ncbi:MAG: MotA/TolQ/ExbB proton channel family protein [Spartobacteria bacterium]|nr:MotA/TolQ/ExbB proton channel family protein [Spartobacteria bacterium]
MRLQKRFLGMVCALGGMGACAARAAEDAQEMSMSLTQIIQTGGWLMYVLGAMSVVGVAMIVYFVVVLRREQVVPREFIKDLHQMLKYGRLAEAERACEKNRSAVAAIATSAIQYVSRSEEMDPMLLKEIMEGEGSRQATMIQNQIQYLLDLAVISPMVGLLGTVMGMLQAFNAVALDIAKAKPMVLASGVSQALITTAAGLFVGIPAMMFYAYFRGRSSKLVSSLEAVSADLLTQLVHEEEARKKEQRAEEKA